MFRSTKPIIRANFTNSILKLEGSKMAEVIKAEEIKKDLTVWENCKLLFGSSPGFLLANFANFGDSIAYFGILTLLTRFLGTNLGMTDHMTGISVSFFTGFVTLFMFGGGFISDRFGVRRALTFSLFVLVVGRVLLAMSPTFGSMSHTTAWTGLFFQALGEGVLYPAIYAATKEYTDERTATIGYGFVYAIMNLGIIGENFLSPYVRTSDHFISVGSRNINGLGWGIDGVFWVCTIITAIVIVAHVIFFNKKVEEKHRRKDIVEAEKQQKAHKTVKERILELPFLDPKFMFFIFILLPVRTLFAHQFLTLPDYVFRTYPAAVSAKFEWIVGLNPLIIVIFVPIFAALTRKVKVVNMMIIGTALTAATTFVLVPGPNTTMLIMYILLFSLGEAMWSSRFLEYVADIAPAGRVGAYMGLAGIPWFLAKFTTGLYSGSMLEIFIPKSGTPNTSMLWLIYAIIACISPIGLIMARKWLLTHKQDYANRK